MQENILPKGFLEKNSLIEISTAVMLHALIVTISQPGLYEETEDRVVPNMDAARREAYEREKEQILSIDTPEDVIKYMRKMKENQNRILIVEKALEMQAEVMPLLLKRLLTSGHEIYIENAATILAYADIEYAEQLAAIFKEIRNPYARSASSIVLGIKDLVDCTSLLLEQFRLIKHERPDKDYEQGPLLALHMIHRK